MEHISLWHKISKKGPNYPELHQHLEVDVAIVGGGITGVTAANELIDAGKTVAIIEGEKIGGVTTGNSTGNLYVPVQALYQTIQRKFNFDEAKAIADTRNAAIDYIEKNIRDKKLNCNFARRPWFAYTKKHTKVLNKEKECFEKMKIHVEEVNTLPLPFSFKQAIKLEHQARFNPLQYVINLTEFLHHKGCHIFENTRVLQVSEKKVCTLTTNKGKVTAKKVILATHTPIGIHATQVFTAAYRSYVVGFHLKNNDYPEGHYWDLDNGHLVPSIHATEENNKPNILLISGNHHKTGQTEHMKDRFRAIERFANKHFAVSETVCQWSAQHFQSADAVPYIGPVNSFSKHIYMATGYWADGLTYGTVAGINLANWIVNRKNISTRTYLSTRFKPIASLPFLLKENCNVLIEYYKDMPFPEHKEFSDIKPGEGKVVEINQEKCAVSRDEHNKLHIVSAVCTHMKCIVNWNDAERTWDCPCHGSRFKHTGEVLEGPATLNLEQKT